MNSTWNGVYRENNLKLKELVSQSRTYFRCAWVNNVHTSCEHYHNIMQTTYRERNHKLTVFTSLAKMVSLYSQINSALDVIPILA